MAPMGLVRNPLVPPAPKHLRSAVGRVPAGRLETLLELSRSVTSTLELEDVLEEFVKRAKELTYAGGLAVSAYDPERDAVVTLAGAAGGAPEKTPKGEETFPLAQYPATRTVLERRTALQVRLSDPHADRSERALLEAQGYRALLMLPLVGQGEVIGLLEVLDEADRSFPLDEVQFWEGVAGIVAVALRNASLYAQTQRLATRDSLTGLGNRALFDEQLKGALARSARSHEPLALLLIDLDGLKSINDRDGHLAGDAALQALAMALGSAVRTGDLICRIGGDEFAAILPGSTRAGALAAGRRVQEKLVELGSYTISGGAAAFEPGGQRAPPTMVELYRSADRAAYLAKRAGGAQIL
jgi:diguanylate cyclase (GGDEF)-like protein